MISIKHLRMEYGENVAIENMHLEIARGEVFGLIGPNGAGKTTLIRVLATLLEPTFGQITIDEVDVLEEPLKVHPLVGYMSDFFSLYDNLRAWEYLDHFARCYRIPPTRRGLPSACICSCFSPSVVCCIITRIPIASLLD